MNVQKARSGMLAVLLTGLGVLGLAACGGDTPTATPVAVPTATSGASTSTDATATTGTTGSTGDATATTGTTGSNTGNAAVDTLTSASEKMKGLKSYHMAVSVDTAGTTTSVEGDVEPPSKARLTTNTAGVSTEVILIDTASYTKVPGSDQYIEGPGDASMLGQTDTSSIASMAQNAKVVGDETLDGIDTTHIQFTTSDTTAGTASSVNAEVWIEKSSGYIHQYKVKSDAGGVTSNTMITYSKFNETISPPIEKPTNIMSVPDLPTP